jgi:trimeric autotransporter adhesin
MRACFRFAALIALGLMLALPAFAEPYRSIDRPERTPLELKNWPVNFEGVLASDDASELGFIQADAVPSAASHFIAIVPCRVVDTRNALGPYGGPKMTGSETRSFDIDNGPCPGIPSGAAAYSVAIGVTETVGNGSYLTAWPTGTSQPLVATITWNEGLTLVTAAIVPSGTGGAISLFTSKATHVTIDINGYFVEGVVSSIAAGGGISGGGTGAVALSLAANVALRDSSNVWTGGNTFNLGLSANGSRITSVGNPTAWGDAANKLYVDSALAGGSPGAFVSFEPATTQTGTQGRALINLTQGANSSGSGNADLLSLRTNALVQTVATNREQFRIDAAGGLLARGQLGVGTIPMTGAGDRMMWYPFRAAFRAGGVDGTQWDDANIGFYSWAGGNMSRASAYATFAFGDQVVVTGVDGAAFGAANLVSGTAGFSTGASNVVGGFTGVAMGYTNRAMGQGTVAIGYRSSACGNYSMALGHRATTGSSEPVGGDCAGTPRTGSFVYGDASTTAFFPSSANNEFAVRAAGGFRFRTNSGASTGCNLPAGSGVFSCTSDRNEKNSFEPLDGEEVLRKVSEIPIGTWSFNSEDGVRHAGPAAQDFHAAFGLGVDDRSIGLTDINGIALKAVQALEVRTRELQEKTAEVEELRKRLERLERILGEP